MDGNSDKPDWRRVASLDALVATGRMVVKCDGRQIALFHAGTDVYACDNRCPHEGYPLSEGDIAERGGDDGCVLTCNWHNWKFRLGDGQAVMGGDDLTVYPTEIRDKAVWVDVRGPTTADRAERAISGLLGAFDRHEYGRMARELARLKAAGGDLLDALRKTITSTASQFEYGTSHAVPAAADWLTLADGFRDEPAFELAAVLESIAYFAWDSRREPRIGFGRGTQPFTEQGFLEAIENEDEKAALAMARGAVAAGLSYGDLEPVLSRAALAHYQDFGHALIYVYKTGQLIEHLGPDPVYEPLLLMLVRSLVLATREDLIPQFRAYGEVSAEIGARSETSRTLPAAADVRSGGLRAILTRIGDGLDPAAEPGTDRFLELHDVLMEAAAWQMLHYDQTYQDQTDLPLAKNVGWLSFTHALTFGNAVRVLCGRTPDLWPQGLLQIGCFLGRNAGFVDPDADMSSWQVGDRPGFFDSHKRQLFDHGEFEYVVAAHLLKLVIALDEEEQATPESAWLATGFAAVNRFLHAPLKRKHVLRTARQAMDFVIGDSVTD